MAIIELDEKTILKIAAGEVIENPASVIKELVENSIDAEANQITVEIKNGGKSYMRVSDNGIGIAKNDMELAFKSHATSKITHYEDLFSLTSMGFRGEALPSIKAVSDIKIISKTKEAEIGHYIYYKNNKKDENIIAHNNGTTVIVENLFKRIPVRAEFMKSSLTEANRINELIQKFAIAHPHIAFKYINNDKTIIQTGGKGIENTLTEIFGPEISSQLLPFKYNSDELNIHGWISNTSLYRGNRSMQYIFVNQRIISDDTLSKIIESAYTGKILNNRFPIFFLWIDIDSTLIDINIHPTKSKIQWKNGYASFQMLKTKILKTLDSDKQKNILLNKKKNKTKEKETKLITIDEFIKKKNLENLKESTTNFETDKKPIEKKPQNIEEVIQVSLEKIEKENIEETPSIFIDWKLLSVFQNTYIIFENFSNKELIIMDQHAAHERILYERFKADVKNDDIRTQMLLIPQSLKLQNHEINILKEYNYIFKKLGYEIDQISEHNYLIRGIPYRLGRLEDPSSMIFSIIDTFNSEYSDINDLSDRIIKKACSYAIKAGDILSDFSISQLLLQLEQCEDPYTCPHGRPTYIRIGLNKIEKWFKRT